MKVDSGPSNFTCTKLYPCPWCKQPTNWLTQNVKYRCNSCSNPVHFFHHGKKDDPTQTEWVEPIKPEWAK